MRTISCLFALLVVPAMMSAAGMGGGLSVQLDVRIDPRERIVEGTARLDTDTASSVSLNRGHASIIEIDGAVIDDNPLQPLKINLLPGRAAHIRYRTTIVDSSAGMIDSEHVLLLDDWYPRPAQTAHYALSVSLPEAFSVVSEGQAGRIEHHDGMRSHHFQFEFPLEAVHLAASSRYTVRRRSMEGVALAAYFFESDAVLAEAYLQRTRQFIAHYQDMLGPFPFDHFAVVETMLPVGRALPGLALFGKDAVRPPFIPETSLAHEILHQWFGHAIRVDPAHGNWTEGLTTYLGDHAIAEKGHRDRAYRKQIMIEREAIIGDRPSMSIARFQQRLNREQQIVGYGQAVMLWHGIRQHVGDRAFFKALRHFVKQHRHQTASWHDLQKAFEYASGQKLYALFAQALDRNSVPRLRVDKARLVVDNGTLQLQFDLVQPKVPFKLRLPLSVRTAGAEYRHYIDIRQTHTSVTIPMDFPPISVRIDENYDLMRRLDEDERPPVLADIMGARRLLVAASLEQRPLYEKLLEALESKAETTFVRPEALSLRIIEAHPVVATGFDTPVIADLFGTREHPAQGVRLHVAKHPWTTANRLLLVHIRDLAEIQSIANKLRHYGKYSDVAFDNGQKRHSTIAESDDGIAVLKRPVTRAVAPDRLPALNDILPHLEQYRVVCIGEKHTQVAHHINQLSIIRQLHAAGVPLAVGMEMFQRPCQNTIDDFMADRIPESTFLEQCGYFEHWGYDYHLYKPIIDYLKKARIPLIALNIDSDIARKVARSGLAGLSAAERRSLPEGMDLTDRAYVADMRKVYQLHSDQSELSRFDHFLQAQALWDESMAAAACQYLQTHPNDHLIVLAGNGHLRHRYGIPRRLLRRGVTSYVVVLQDEALHPGIADYVLRTQPIEAVGAPKLGISVDASPSGLLVTRVFDHSVAAKGGLVQGDRIERFDGLAIHTLADLKRALFVAGFGRTIVLDIRRNDRLLQKQVRLVP